MYKVITSIRRAWKQLWCKHNRVLPVVAIEGKSLEVEGLWYSWGLEVCVRCGRVISFVNEVKVENKNDYLTSELTKP